MTELIRVEQISEFVDTNVQIRGWIYNRTRKGKLVFLLVRDGYGFVQCVAFKNNLPDDVFNNIAYVPQETAVKIIGTVRADSRAPGLPGGFEIGITSFEIIGTSEEDYPMALKEHGVDFALDNRHFWIRMPSQWAILRIRSSVISAINTWLHENGFILMDTPILTPSAAEGTTTLFGTEYFDEGTVYLAQTGQLYNEANIYAFNRVYCFGPTFRAEKSKTRRHLTEFWMVEPEIAFCDLEELMEIEEEFISYIVQKVLQERRPELLSLERDISVLEKISPPFPRISYDEATDLLIQICDEMDDPDTKKLLNFEWGMDFGSPHETALTERFEKPVFVYGFPTAIKAFYMEPWTGRPEICKSVDLLAPEGYGEIIGGSERISDPEMLLARIRDHELPEESYKWYIDLRRFGSVPHSGFGLGLERMVTWITGIRHIRETIPFPRTINRIYP
jgi:asparaginyl-tRNA synthetase